MDDQLSVSHSVYGRLQITGGELASFTERIHSHLLGIADGQFTANASRNVVQMLAVIVPWEEGLVVNLNRAYQASMTIKVRGVDAERVEFTGDNSFGHTMALFADVYDDQGNLLQGVLSAAQGIGYQSLAAVPEPSSWLLMAIGMAGLAGWRRHAAAPADGPAAQAHGHQTKVRPRRAESEARSTRPTSFICPEHPCWTPWNTMPAKPRAACPTPPPIGRCAAWKKSQNN